MAASLGNGVDPRSGGVAVPMDWMPLGDYEAFQSWSGRPRSWGPSDVGWRAWFGGQVIDGLCSVLDEHLAAYLPAPVPSLALATGRGVPAAIGCVPWLTSAAVVDCLFKLGACCIVIDKGTLRPPAIRLLDSHLGFPNVALPQLENVTPAVNGEPMIVGPGTPREAMEHELEPVRVLGVRDRDSRKPLLHAKLLVLGEIRWITYSPASAPEFEELRFVPQSVWWGSGNWTEGSRSHLEVGFMSDDPSLVREATDFVATLIQFSEPADTTCVAPEPNLLYVDYEDAAFIEYERERGEEPDDCY